MSVSNKVDIVRGDDWEVIYINGMKILEGHSVPLWEVLNALRIPYKEYSVTLEDYPDVWDENSVPDD